MRWPDRVSPAGGARNPRRSVVAGSPAPSSASTIAWTSGVLGRSLCPTVASAHTDCTGTLIAPSRRAVSGGVTVRSWVVQIDTQVGPVGVSSRALSRRRTSLSVANWRHASGQASIDTVPARSASDVPWLGEPSMTTRRVTSAPPSATHSLATMPPAE